MDDDPKTDPRTDEISQLVRQLGHAEARLRELTDDQVDAVLDPESGTPILLQNAQRELQQNQARLRLLLEHLPATVWTTDSALRLTSLSRTDPWMPDLEPDELIGRRLVELDRLSNGSELIEIHRRALRGETASVELRLRGRVYDCSVEPMRDVQQDIVGCVGLAVDVTPRVEVERALRESQQELEHRVEERTSELSQAYQELQVTEEEIRQQNEELRAARSDLEAERQRYRELFEFAPDGYIVTDEGGIVEGANQAAKGLLGMPASSLIGKPLVLFIAPEDQETFYSMMNQVRDDAPGTRSEMHLGLRPHDGDPFPASVAVAPVGAGERQGAGLRWMVRDVSDSRRLLIENRRQRVFLERLMNVAPVGIAVVRGEDHRFEMANTYYRSIPGARRPIAGRTFAQVFGPETAEQASKVLDRVYHTARPVRLHERQGPPDVDERPTYWNADLVPLQDLDGGVNGVLILARDVSQEVRARKEMERLAGQVQRQADQLNAVFNAMTDAVLVFNAQGVPVRANPAVMEALGRDPIGGERTKLAEGLELRDPQGRPVPVERLPSSRALRGERVERARYRLMNAQGSELMVAVSAAPLRTDGRVTGCVVVWRDVTERERLLAEVDAQRRRAEHLAADLQQQQDKLQTIMENTHAQLAYLDADFNFVHVNTAYAEGAGYAREELIGQNHFELFPDRENEAIFRRVLETGKSVSFRGKPFVYTEQPRRGVTYWDWSLVPVKNRNDEVTGLVFSLLNVTEREQLMRQLDAEQSRLNAIIKNSPEGIVVVDHQARITLTNPAADQLYDRQVPYGEDYASHADLCLCYPDGTAYRPRDLPLTRAALDGERHEDLELALVRPSGEQRDLLISAAPIRDRSGEVRGAVGVFRDITERKRIEEALRRYARRLQVLHELDQAILLARSGEEIAEAALGQLRQLVPCRRASVELFDLQAEETSLLAVDADGETRMRKGRRLPLTWNRSLEALREGRAHVVEDLSLASPSPAIEALRQEGIRSFISLPLRAHGELMGALNVGRETVGPPPARQMTAIDEIAQQVAIGIRQARLYEALQAYADELEQRVANRTAQLRSSEARFRAIFEQSALGIALLDEQGRVMVTNQALQSTLGRKQDELVGRRFTDFAHPDEAIEEDVVVYRRMRAGERDRHRVETRYVQDDGDVGWANMVLSLVRDSEGQPQFIIAMVEDITERKKAQEALIQAEKLATTGRLAASLAHEINNPLQTVIGCLGLAEESMEADRGEVEMYVTMAHDELKRAARIVSRLRDLSRPSDPKTGEATNVNGLVESVLGVSRKDLKDHRIRLVRDLAEDLPQPVLMPDRIKQVLLNLVLNARDAMAHGGELTVSTRYDAEEDAVEIAVADQGPGMSEEVMRRLFDPFFSTKAEGTGLGLFVSRNILHEHGGEIEVESTVGEGSTFTIILPLSRR